MREICAKLGVSLRVELCKDTTEMLQRLENGDADLIAFLAEADKNRQKAYFLRCGS